MSRSFAEESGADASRSGPGGQDLPADRALVVAARAGDEQAFGLIVTRYHARILNLAFRMVGNFDDAHDVAQETFIRAHAGLSRFRDGASVFTWIYRIAVNNCINLLRKKKLRSFIRLDFCTDLADGSEALISCANPGGDLEAAEIRDRVDRALARLPARQRLVFVLRQFDGMTHPQIAEVIGCTDGAVRASYFHAVRKLQEALCDLR